MISVAIVGPGLIGGSLGLALRRIKKNGKRKYHVIGLSRSEKTLRLAKKRKAIDFGIQKPSSLLGKASVVFLCVPVQHMASVAKRIKPYVKPGTIITDVGSVKEPIIKDLNKIFSKKEGIHVVGGHPIAGSEKWGVAHAKADLFKGSTCIVAKDKASKKSISTITQIWRDAGSRVLVKSARWHDHILAQTSHLPHLMAFALLKDVIQSAKKDKDIRLCVGASYRDMTRIAGSNPEIWEGIISHNKKAVKKVVSRFDAILKSFLRQNHKHLLKQLSQLSRAKKSW